MHTYPAGRPPIQKFRMLAQALPELRLTTDLEIPALWIASHCARGQVTTVRPISLSAVAESHRSGSSGFGALRAQCHSSASISHGAVVQGLRLASGHLRPSPVLSLPFRHSLAPALRFPRRLSARCLSMPFMSQPVAPASVPLAVCRHPSAPCPSSFVVSLCAARSSSILVIQSSL